MTEESRNRRSKGIATMPAEQAAVSSRPPRDYAAVKDEFLGILSHELRRPVTIILGLARLLERSSSSGSTPQGLAAELRGEAETLERLLEDLLRLARLDTEPSEGEPVLLARLLPAWVAEQERRLSAHRLALLMSDRILPVNGRPGWLKIVFDNLVENAAKYAPLGSTIDVVLTRDEDTIVVEVLDRGPGIDASSAVLLFERFSRGGQFDSGTAGAGLGLSISRRLMQLQNGSVSFRPRRGGGSVFSFSLPVLL